MNKHQLLKNLKHIKPVYFLVLAAICAVICIFALRANNQHMVVLRDTVYQADKDNGDVQAALKNLQAYVTRHMNTNLSAGPNAVYPPIQLKYTYDRLVQQQSAQRSAANNQIYTDAQHYCEGLNSTDFSGRNRVPCIQQYVESHGGQVSPTISDDLYKFSFASPTWSPDLAGWSLIGAIVFAFAFIVTFIVSKILPRI
jgi:hypothetical protein